MDRDHVGSDIWDVMRRAPQQLAASDILYGRNAGQSERKLLELSLGPKALLSINLLH